MTSIDFPPSFAPWNGTQECLSNSDCVIAGIPPSLTNCHLFIINDNKKHLCTCSKTLYLEGPLCSSSNPAGYWDGIVQLSLALAVAVTIVWVSVTAVQKNVLQIPLPLKITFVLNYFGMLSQAIHMFARGSTIVWTYTETLVVMNRLGLGLTLAFSTTTLIVLILSWQSILCTSSKGDKTFLSQRARKIVFAWALVNSCVLTLLYLVGRFQEANTLATLVGCVLLAWYNIVGKRLLSVFRINESFSAGPVKSSLEAVVSRIRRLIFCVTCSIVLMQVATISLYVIAVTFDAKRYYASGFTILLIYSTHVTIMLAFLSVANFVLLARSPPQARNKISPNSS